MIYVGFATLVIAMGVTWVVTPGVIRLGAILGAVDLPGGRKTHHEPMPRIGGLAVFLGFVGGLSFAAYATGSLFVVYQNSVNWRGLAVAATALLLVGLADDLWGLSFKLKFLAQIAAAVYVWQVGFRIDVLTHPLGGMVDLGWLSLPVTILWIVGVTNAVNLIDGLDGLAAGIALITTTAVAVIAMASHLLGVTAAAVALAGALIGFLRYNFNPARIFLGDSGSLFLGFVLAVIAVRGSQKGPTAVAVLGPLLVLGLPLLDTGLAVVRRFYGICTRGMRSEKRFRYVVRNAKQIFLPDRGHIHHRLLDLGLSHRVSVLVLYGVAGLFVLAAFSLVLLKSLWIALLLLAVLAFASLAFVVLVYHRVRRDEVSDFREVPAPERSPATASEPFAARRREVESG